jgi:hypothetical protein
MARRAAPRHDHGRRDDRRRAPLHRRPSALGLGFVAGVLEFIPYLGPILSAILGTAHRLVKLRVPGGGYACHAIIDARWCEADLAQQLGTWVEAWKEQDADQVQALVARRVLGRPDVR